jgi:hypothetical protein
MTKDYPT